MQEQLQQPAKTRFVADGADRILKARQWRLVGRVQGVGFRPAVYRCALQLGVVGWVCNSGGELQVHAEGSSLQLTLFFDALKSAAPESAVLTDVIEVTASVEGSTSFLILPSISEPATAVHPPVDVCVCEDCLLEMSDVNARRYRYPFINCTQCGPRYTLIKALPYDRENTTMSDFEMCPECLTEYIDPADRRHHAQPLACVQCGPWLVWQQGSERVEGNDLALQAALIALRAGLTIAARGIGGYHLLCDATSSSAVANLRRQKHRPTKPLAVLVPLAGEDGLEVARQVAEISPAEASALLRAERPIVLLSKSAGSSVDEGVAPGLGEFGVMLPYSPLLQLLTADFGQPLVATSGNVSGEPILSSIADAEQHLAGVAHGFLHHNRTIQRVADDSVMRFIADRPRPLRLGRGSTPLEMTLTRPVLVPTVCVGALQKNTIALAWNNRVAISPHIGDFASTSGYDLLLKTIAEFQALYGVKAKRLVHDAHPGVHPNELGLALGIPTSANWHHFAHASAVAGEYFQEEPMLCFTWDGNGYGEDKTLWGGEALLGGPGNWQRVASFRSFPLLGGERTALQPWRLALGLAWETGHAWPLEALLDLTHDVRLLHAAYQYQINCPATSAVGRLFDAAAGLLGLCLTTTYPAEAAMLLESICPRDIALESAVALPLEPDAVGILRSDWQPLLPMLLDQSQSVSVRSGRFHASLALALCEQAREICARTGVMVVGLSGGVFQNRRLTELVEQQLKRDGFRVLIPEQMPVNDAAISFGQIVETAAFDSRQCQAFVAKDSKLTA